MKRLNFILTMFVAAAALAFSSCNKEGEDSEDSANKTVYSVDYVISSLGDIPNFAVVDVTYITNDNVEVTESNVESYSWSHSASSVTTSKVKMKISLTKRVPFDQKIVSGEIEAKEKYQATMDYSITSKILGVTSSHVGTSSTTTVNSEVWEAYIDMMVGSPLTIELEL